MTSFLKASIKYTLLTDWLFSGKYVLDRQMLEVAWT